MQLARVRFNIGRLMLAVALAGLAIAFLKFIVDFINAPWSAGTLLRRRREL
jgi:hypothetical protein